MSKDKKPTSESASEASDALKKLMDSTGCSKAEATATLAAEKPDEPTPPTNPHPISDG